MVKSMMWWREMREMITGTWRLFTEWVRPPVVDGQSSPIERLAELILNEASEKQATQIRMRRSGHRVDVLFLIDGTWESQDRPPVYIWPNLANVLVLFAGLEPWQKGERTGRIDRSVLTDRWWLTCSNQVERIDLTVADGPTNVLSNKEISSHG